MRLRSRVEWIESYVPSTAKIIDLGAGDLFVYRQTNLKPHTIVDKNYFFEEGKLYLRSDVRVCEVPKIYTNALIGSACDVSFPKDFFDVCVMSEILEHLKKPKEAVERALKFSRLIVGTVPKGWHNSEFPTCRVFNEKEDLWKLFTHHANIVREIESKRDWEGFGFGFVCWR